MTVLNNILLLITRSRLSIAQASSSFKRLNMCTFMYATPTFITEVLCLLTQVQLVLMNFTVNITPYTVLAYFYWVSFHDKYQCQGYDH